MSNQRKYLSAQSRQNAVKNIYYLKKKKGLTDAQVIDYYQQRGTSPALAKQMLDLYRGARAKLWRRRGLQLAIFGAVVVVVGLVLTSQLSERQLVVGYAIAGFGILPLGAGLYQLVRGLWDM